MFGLPNVGFSYTQNLKSRYSQKAYTGIPHFIAFSFMFHRCVFYKLKARPSTSEKFTKPAPLRCSLYCSGLQPNPQYLGPAPELRGPGLKTLR